MEVIDYISPQQSSSNFSMRLSLNGNKVITSSCCPRPSNCRCYRRCTRHESWSNKVRFTVLMINKLGQPLIYTWIEAHDKWSGYVLVLSPGFNPNLHRRSMWQFCSLANQGKPYVSHRPKSKNVHKISKRSITYIENPCSYSITHPFIKCSSVVVILGLGKSRFNTTPSQLFPSTIFSQQ